MARADRRRAQREARHARPTGRKAGGSSPRVAENTMFFPRLRNQAKWAFVLLIIVFAGGFVFLGVGSGGLDLGQLIRDAFGNNGSSGTSVSEAQTEGQRAPVQRPCPQGARKRAWRRRVASTRRSLPGGSTRAMKPKDVVALRHLGQLELGQADRYLREAQLASLAQQDAGVGSPFRPSPPTSSGRRWARTRSRRPCPARRARRCKRRP